MYDENSYQLIGKKIIRDYIYGGKGIVTLRSPTGVHHTYYFKRPTDRYNFPDDVLFVYALHNKTQHFYVGMIENNQFRLTKCSRFGEHTPIVKGVRYILKMMFHDIDTPMKLYHEGVCSICGRKLTNPKSLDTGIGPKCRRIYHV